LHLAEKEVNKMEDRLFGTEVGHGSFGIMRIIVTIFSIVELILAFRFILKLLGANSLNRFALGINNLTQLFVGLFDDILAYMQTTILSMQCIFEPKSIIASFLLAVLACYPYGISRFFGL
jgi:hypothetical protein